ncbi:OmpA family protein [Hyphomonas sp.]|uniref:OmpA family protein n=1 Tax=Hyphomonas sp. TaxID=87 RepID=UPI003D26F5C0|tara:strand:- start:8227 stop:8673 length:447 start_codon:yes stop_codon:yes gene_type:complete
MKNQYLLFAPLLMVACVSNPAPPVAPAGPEAVAAAPDCSLETFAIYFDEGASELSDESDAVVDAVSDTFARCDLYKMEIEGHADASGDAVTNQAISAARAEAVLAALRTRGVDAERVHLVASGEKGAVTDEGAVPINRRTEVRLVPES